MLALTGALRMFSIPHWLCADWLSIRRRRLRRLGARPWRIRRGKTRNELLSVIGGWPCGYRCRGGLRAVVPLLCIRGLLRCGGSQRCLRRERRRRVS